MFCAARLRSASAIAAAEKGALGHDTFFLGHHSPKYFLTAGHLRCLAGLVPWRVALDGGEGREEGGEARRAPLPLGFSVVFVVLVVFVVFVVFEVFEVQSRMVVQRLW